MSEEVKTSVALALANLADEVVPDSGGRKRQRGESEAGSASGTLDAPAKGSRRRKGGPKVRSACITCKIRRVKCDETHPSCNRCLNYWGHCEGYASTKNKPFHPGRPVPKARPILPQKIPGVDLRERGELALAEGRLRQPYTGPVFDSVDEYDGFKMFLHSTSSALSGAFEGPTWAYHLPQHASTEPFIRYGIAALGSMTAVFMEVMFQRMNGVPAEEEGHCLGNSPAYLRTLALYAKSLRHMRIALSKPGHTMRDTMLGCLLVVCFEGFHGHNYASMLHAQNGLKLFYSWLGKQPCVTSITSPFQSPNRADLEDDIVHSLLRLDIQVLSFFDTRSSDYHMEIAQHGDKVLRSMPSSFLSLFQARTYWDMISRRTCHFLASALSAAGATSLALMLNGPTEPYPEELGVPNGIKLFAQSPIIPVGYEIERAKYAADIEAWERAFASLHKHLLASAHSQARGASILSMHAKMISILLSGAFFQSEMEYDTLTPIFRAIVALATSIWSTHTIAAGVGVSYNFDLGILPPLFLVGTRCRDRVVRREAISLLLTDFHRENAWDSFGTALISRWIMGMEEDGVSRDQTTPEVEWIYGQDKKTNSSKIDPPWVVQNPMTSSFDEVRPKSMGREPTDEPLYADWSSSTANPKPSTTAPIGTEPSYLINEPLSTDSTTTGYIDLDPEPTESTESTNLLRHPWTDRIRIERRMRDHLDRSLPTQRPPLTPLSTNATKPPPQHAKYLAGPKEDHETARMQTTTEAKVHCATLEWEEQPVPEATRLRISRFNVDLNMRRAQLEYTQGRVGIGEKVERKRHVVLW